MPLPLAFSGWIWAIYVETGNIINLNEWEKDKEETVENYSGESSNDVVAAKHMGLSNINGNF